MDIMLGRFADREVAVVGMGRSNRALCRYLVREGARVTCFDRKTAEDMGEAYRELGSLGVEWSLGEGYLGPLPEFEWIFLTPGMKKDLPEIRRARERGAVTSCEIGLFLERCRGRVGGVTGSAGKTTTATLAGLMLRESSPGAPVYVGGNIGEVLIEKVDSIPENAAVVLELSSFQLELLTRSPEVGLVLNVRPNHLDIHESYEDYVEAKKRIFRFQAKDDWCVLNLDDPISREMAGEGPGRAAYFTLDPRYAREALAKGHPAAWLEGADLLMCPPVRSGEPVHLTVRQDFLVPGRHNVSNALAAAMLATLLGATPAGIRAAIRSFRGVEHRIELVREFRSVRYYNDSIATAPDRTEALLEAVPGPLVLIMGGYDKGLSFDELAEKIAARGCSVVTLGKTAPKIEEALERAYRGAGAGEIEADRARVEGTGGGSQIRMNEAGAGEARGGGAVARPHAVRAGSLEEAVRLAASAAPPGGSVVLSPACASFDMFTSFEERGARFKELVRGLA